MINQILRFLFGNLLFKIFAVILALAIWVLAVLIRVQTISLTIPLESTNLPQNLVVKQINNSKIKVQLEGRGSDFLKFIFRPPIYKLDLAMSKTGLNRIKLAPDELVVSAPVLLKSISPEYVEITIDELDRKKVIVAVPYQLDLKKGFYVTNIVVQDTVVLYGPEQDLQFIRQVNTESLMVSDFSATEVIRRLKVQSPEGGFFKVDPESITAKAFLEKEESCVFADVPVSVFGPSQVRITIIPKLAQIKVRGAKSLIQKLQKSDIRVQIKSSELIPGDYNLPAEIILPKGIFLVHCDPALFEVKFQ